MNQAAYISPCNEQKYACGFAETAAKACAADETFWIWGAGNDIALAADGAAISTATLGAATACTATTTLSFTAVSSSASTEYSNAPSKSSSSGDQCPKSHETAVGIGLGIPLGLALLALTFLLGRRGFSRTRSASPSRKASLPSDVADYSLASTSLLPTDGIPEGFRESHTPSAGPINNVATANLTEGPMRMDSDRRELGGRGMHSELEARKPLNELQ
jgi:hypothetical protein